MTELIDRIGAALGRTENAPGRSKRSDPRCGGWSRARSQPSKPSTPSSAEIAPCAKQGRIDIALRTAKLLPVKTVESFDFAFQPSLDRERIAAPGPARLHPETRNRPLPRDRPEPESPPSRPRSASPPSKPERASTKPRSPNPPTAPPKPNDKAGSPKKSASSPGPRCSSSMKSDTCPSPKAEQACSSKSQMPDTKKAR